MSSKIHGSGEGPDFDKFTRMEKYVSRDVKTPADGTDKASKSQIIKNLGSMVCTKLIRLGHLANTVFAKGTHAEWLNNKKIFGRMSLVIETLEGKERLVSEDNASLTSLATAIDAYKNKMMSGGDNDKILDEFKNRIKSLKDKMPVPINKAPAPPTESRDNTILGIKIGPLVRDEANPADHAAIVVAGLVLGGPVSENDAVELKQMEKDIDDVTEEVRGGIKEQEAEEDVLTQLLSEIQSTAENEVTERKLEEANCNYDDIVKQLINQSKEYLDVGHVGSAYDLSEAVSESQTKISVISNSEYMSNTDKGNNINRATISLKQKLEEVKKEDAKREEMITVINEEIRHTESAAEVVHPKTPTQEQVADRFLKKLNHYVVGLPGVYNIKNSGVFNVTRRTVEIVPISENPAIANHLVNMTGTSLTISQQNSLKKMLNEQELQITNPRGKVLVDLTPDSKKVVEQFVRNMFTGSDSQKTLRPLQAEVKEAPEYEKLETKTVGAQKHTGGRQQTVKKERPIPLQAEEKEAPEYEKLETKTVGAQKLTTVEGPQTVKKLTPIPKPAGAWGKPLQEQLKANEDKKQKALEEKAAYERSYAAKAKKGAEASVQRASEPKVESPEEKQIKEKRVQEGRERFIKKTTAERTTAEVVKPENVKAEPIPKFKKFAPVLEKQQPGNVFEVLTEDAGETKLEQKKGHKKPKMDANNIEGSIEKVMKTGHFEKTVNASEMLAQYVDIQEKKLESSMEYLVKLSKLDETLKGIAQVSPQILGEVRALVESHTKVLKQLQSAKSEVLTADEALTHKGKVDAAIAKAMSAVDSDAPFTELTKVIERFTKLSSEVDHTISQYRESIDWLYIAANLDAVKKKIGERALEIHTQNEQENTRDAIDAAIGDFEGNIKLLEKALTDAKGSRSLLWSEGWRDLSTKDKANQMMKYLEGIHGRGVEKLQDYRTLRQQAGK